MTEARDPMLDPVREVARSWGWFLVYGVVLAVLGLVALFQPKNTAGIIVMIFGIGMIVAGAFDIIGAIGHHDEGARWSGVIVGVVSMVLGIVVLRHIHGSVELVGLILGIFWLVRGVVMVVSGVVERDLPGRGWRIIGGLIFTVLGAYVLGFPTTGPALIMWLLGLLFVLSGIIEIIVAFHVKGLAKNT